MCDITYSYGYQVSPGGTVGFFDAPRLLLGGGDGTSYTVLGPAGGSASLTAIWCLWTSQAFDTVTWQGGFEAGATFDVDTSLDGVTWTTQTVTLTVMDGDPAFPAPTTIATSGDPSFTAGTGTYAVTWYRATIASVSALYVRLSVKDTASDADVPKVSLLQWSLSHSGSPVTATPHTYGAPTSSGGFALTGYYTLRPGNNIGWSPSNLSGNVYGNPQTDHPGSGLILTAFENTQAFTPTPGSPAPFQYVYPPPVTTQTLTTDADGQYHYNYGGSGLQSLFLASGPYVSATYADYMAFWYGPSVVGPCYAVVAFGAFDTTTNLPIPDQCAFFAQDPAYPQYASLGYGYRANGPSSPNAIYFSGFCWMNNGQIPAPTFWDYDGDYDPATQMTFVNPITYPWYNGGPFGWNFTGNVGVAWTPYELNTGAAAGPYFLNGSWTADFMSPTYANVTAWQKTNGNWQIWEGAAITVTDSYGRTETVTSTNITGGDVRTGGGMAPTAANGFLQVTNPLYLTGATVNTTGATLVTLAYNQPNHGQPSVTGANANYELSPVLGPGATMPVGSDSYLNCLSRSMFWCQTSPSNGAGAPTTLRADSYAGVLALAWTDSGGGLYVATHPSPLGNIGSGAAGWDATQTLATSGESACAIGFLQGGRCLLAHTTACSFSDHFGRSNWSALATDWFAATGVDVAYLTSAGRAERCGWLFNQLDGAVFQNYDQAGLEWFGGSGSGVTAGFCASMRNGRYEAAGTATNTLDVNVGDGPGDWRSTGGTVGSITSGQCAGICYTDSGVLVGLWWDYVAPSTGTKQCYCLRSYDQGVTWTKDSALIPASVIPPLAVPPAIVALPGGYVCAVWLTGSSSPLVPQFAISADGGATWA